MTRLPFLRCLSTLALAAALLLTTGAAAEPVARIVAPTENTPGNLVVLRTDGTVGTGHTWKIIPAEAEQFFLPILDSSGAQAAVFSTNKGGTFTFILTVSENGAVDWEAKTIQPSQTAIAVHTLVQGKPTPPEPDDPDPDEPEDPDPSPRATAATYIYEKDQHAIPGPVLAALNRLNRERGIIATVLEADTTDGTGEVPEQYKAALAAAKSAGLPCLVVTGAAGVIRVVKNPATEQAVLDAVPTPSAMRKAG